MSTRFLDATCRFVQAEHPLSAAEQADARLSLEDTMAVLLAGWHMPVVAACLEAFDADRRPLIDGGTVSSPEVAAFVHATASHALDYDDVHLTSVTHPSAVILPALLSLGGRYPDRRARLLESYSVGLAVNAALGEALGFEHYEAGWHATSTIGAVAGAAALAHHLALDEPAIRSALALAAAQAGGLQRNFGSMAKPVQIGNAAAAAVRSALLAASGVTADQNIFGPKGFLDLYGDKKVGARLSGVTLSRALGSLSRKLYPCCYATHRLIAAAAEARMQLPNGALPAKARITVLVPFGTMRPLRILNPTTGAEAQFCATYAVALGLLTGSATLKDFSDAAVSRPDVRELMTRITVTEDRLEGEMPLGLDHGSVRLSVVADNELVASADVATFPGSPAAPATAAALSAKVADCLNRYTNTTGRHLALADFQLALQQVSA